MEVGGQVDALVTLPSKEGPGSHHQFQYKIKSVRRISFLNVIFKKIKSIEAYSLWIKI